MAPKKSKILVIDDDKELTAAFASFLREAGYVAVQEAGADSELMAAFVSKMNECEF